MRNIPKSYIIGGMFGVAIGTIIYLVKIPFRFTEDYMKDAVRYLDRIKRKSNGELPLMNRLEINSNKIIDITPQKNNLIKRVK